MDRALKEELLELLKDIIPYARGILVYGSVVKGYADRGSDIDICVIPKAGIDVNELYERILAVSADERYDIVIFDAIPWYLRGEILEAHEILYAEDEATLDFWLYKRLKIWSDMKRRQRLIAARDLIERASVKKRLSGRAE